MDKISLNEAVLTLVFSIIGLLTIENVSNIFIPVSLFKSQTSKSCSGKENPCSLERYLIILSAIYSFTPSTESKSLRVASLILVEDNATLLIPGWLLKIIFFLFC